MLKIPFDLESLKYPQSLKRILGLYFTLSLAFWFSCIAFLGFIDLKISIPPWIFYYAFFVLISPLCLMLYFKIKYWNTPPTVMRYTTDALTEGLYATLLALYMLPAVFAFFSLPNLSIWMVSALGIFAVLASCHSFFLFHKLKQQAKQLNYPWVNLVVQQDHIEYVPNVFFTRYSPPKDSLLGKIGDALAKVTLYVFPAATSIGYFLNKADESGSGIVVFGAFAAVLFITIAFLPFALYSFYNAYLLRQVQKQHNKPIYRYR